MGLGNPSVVMQASKALDDMQMMYERKKGEWGMVLSYVILLLCRSTKSRITDHFLNVIKDQWEKQEPEYTIPDFALDIHTSQGNLLGRTKGSKAGINHFITEGERLKNIHPTLQDPYHEIVKKLWSKKVDE